MSQQGRLRVGRRELGSLNIETGQASASSLPQIVVSESAETRTPTLGLPPVSKLPNPEKLIPLSGKRLSDDPSGFRSWKNTIQAEFDYYGIKEIIEGTHSLPDDQPDAQHWQIIEQLFVLKLATTLPPTVYELVKCKTTLRDKWLTTISQYTRSDLSKVTTDLMNITWETTETVQEFAIRLRELWENLERCGQPTAEPYRIEQLMTKMETVFPVETREMRRSRDLRHLTWDYVVETYKEIEHTRPT